MIVGTLIFLGGVLLIVVLYGLAVWITKDPHKRNPESHS